jgi:putative two-component system response regulator
MENKRSIIMLVDDIQANLTAGKTMLKDKYDVFTLPSAAKFFELLQKVTPDLILMDIDMPEMNGYEAIKKLKGSSAKNIPVVFLTARSDHQSEFEGLSLGAVDYVFKPFSPPLLIKRIENHLLMEAQRRSLQEYNENLQKKVQEKTKQVVALQHSIVGAMAELVESRDDVTGGHIERTKAYFKLLVDKLWEEKIYWDDISGWQLEYLVDSTPLHDLGKIAISDLVLNKPGKLDPEEFEIMKKHTTFGEEAVEAIMQLHSANDFLEHAKILAGTHHEKWDGTGYPRGLKAESIPLQGRIMAIADVYDALISTRPYKPPMSTEKAAQIIEEGKGSQFDPILVDVFMEVAPQFAAIAEKSRQAVSAAESNNS